MTFSGDVSLLVELSGFKFVDFDTNFDVLGLFRFVTEVEHLPSVIREQHQPQRPTSSPVAAAASAESAPPAAAESPAAARIPKWAARRALPSRMWVPACCCAR